MKTITFIITILAFINTAVSQEQIKLSFANVTNTNDGEDTFYEADVMINTNNGYQDFKLGSGLLYINYNPEAFGENVVSENIEVSSPEGYILNLSNGFPYYNNFILNNNTSSRFAFSFQQGVSSGTMIGNNVTSTPTLLFHFKIKYDNPGEPPSIAFEDNEEQPPGVYKCRDQFFAACGPEDSTGFPDCVTYSGMQFQNALFDSSQPTLFNESQMLSSSLVVYPNPVDDVLHIKNGVNLVSMTLFDTHGKKIIDIEGDAKTINVSNYSNGIYFLKFKTDTGEATKRIIINR